MNDLDLIRGFRARVKDPDPERVEAAWANILPRLWEPAVLPPSRPVSTRHRWIVPAGLAAGVVALAIALPIILPGGSPGGPGSAEAARVLRRIAVVAADRPAQPPLVPGQYLYSKARSASTSLYVPGNGLANFSFTESSAGEAWIGPDGSGRNVSTPAEVSFPTAEDRAAWIAAGSPDLGVEETTDESFGPGELPFLDLSELPTDPQELLALIEEREIVGGPPGDWETFAIVGDLLRPGTYAPPVLRAALYEVVANLSGIEYLGRIKDAAGRPGLAVASTHDGIRTVMIFDPDTAQLLGKNEVLVDPDELSVEVGPETWPGTIVYGPGRRGMVLFSVVYLASGIVESTTATPEKQD
jgi:hypothetical protein